MTETDKTNNMDKVFSTLGIEKLDADKQRELIDTIKSIIDSKVKELVELKLKELNDAGEEVSTKIDEKLVNKQKVKTIPADSFKWLKQRYGS